MTSHNYACAARARTRRDACKGEAASAMPASTTAAADIDASSATDRGQKQTMTTLSTMVSRRPLMFEESIEPVVPGMSDEHRFLLDMQGCKNASLVSP